MSLWSRLFGGSASELYRRGMKLFNDGDYDGAAAALEQVVSDVRSRGSPLAKLGAFYAAEARTKLGIAEFRRGHHDKALEHFEAALKENPHYPDLYYYVGVVCHEQGGLEKAIENFQRATSINP